MIPVTLDMKELQIDMQNIINYSEGFFQGVEQGRTEFLKNLGIATIESLKEFIDSNARLNPEALHHVYEWYQIGSPNARLFNITFSNSNSQMFFKSHFSQSRSVQDGAGVPFSNKAEIMELGKSVVVKPRGQNPLVFEDNGETVFTKTPVTIDSPGGRYVEGSYEQVFNQFFASYFTQAFLRSSGIIEYIQNPKVFKYSLPAGKKGGRSVGVKVGYDWMAKAGEV